MSQTMNGLSNFSGNGISDSDNISCNNISSNNIACNNVTSNGGFIGNLTVLQTNGTTGTYSGVVSANKFSSDKIQSTDISCNNLLSTFIKSTDISCNTFFSTSISCDNITNIRENCGLLLTPTSVENILIGVSSGNYLSGGCSYNIGIGHQCYDSELISNSSGNIALGFKAGLNMKAGGGDNMYLGNLTGVLGTDTNVYNNSCCIGNNSYISASNTIFLGTANESVVVRGDLVCQSDISSNAIVCSSINSGSIGCNSLSVSNSELTSTMIDNLLNLNTNVQDRLDRISKDSTAGDNTNLCLGVFSGSSLTTGKYNVSIGYNAMLYSITGGDSNISIGQYSGINQHINSNKNICIGFESGQNPGNLNLLSNSVAIGSNSKFNKSNEVVLGTNLSTIRIDGKVECDDIINKGKIKYGRNLASVNGLTTVFFPIPFPLGTLPMIQLTPIFPINLPNTGFLSVYDYDNTNFRYAYYRDNIHAESSILVNWMAMIP